MEVHSHGYAIPCCALVLTGLSKSFPSTEALISGDLLPLFWVGKGLYHPHRIFLLLLVLISCACVKYSNSLLGPKSLPGTLNSFFHVQFQ